MHVHLHDLLARHVARIGHVHRHGQAIDVPKRLRRDAQVAVSVAGIAQAVTKGVEHVHPFGVIVTVADVRALPIADHAVLARVVEERRRILQPSRKGLCELARGIDGAEQHVGDRATPGLAHHPRLDHGRHLRDPGIHHHRRTAVQDDYALRLGRSDRLDQGDLLLRQAQIGPVVAL